MVQLLQMHLHQQEEQQDHQLMSKDIRLQPVDQLKETFRYRITHTEKSFSLPFIDA